MEDHSMSGVHKRTRSEGDDTDSSASDCGSDHDSDCGSDHDSDCDYDYNSDYDCGSGPEFDSDGEKDDDWDAGLLYARGNGVTLCLMNTVKGTLQNCARHIVFRGYAGTGFAVLESKVYALGSSQRFSGIRDIFVYDLKNRGRKFKYAARLKTPKTAPIVIPYLGTSGNNKLFIIPISDDVAPKNRSCEVVLLPGNENSGYECKPLKTPFDAVYKNAGGSPLSFGCVVKGKYAYISLYSSIWERKHRLICLDMDNDQFNFCDSPNFSYFISSNIEPKTEGEKEHEKACRSTFAKSIYCLGNYMHYVCRDKFFLVTCSAHASNVKVYVSSNLSSEKKHQQPIACFDEEVSANLAADLGLEPLEEVENYVNRELKDFSSLVKVWTLPFDDSAEEENTYSMFICYVSLGDEWRLLVCKFKLVDQSETDDDSAGKSTYKYCEVLSHALFRRYLPQSYWFVQGFTSRNSSMSLLPEYWL